MRMLHRLPRVVFRSLFLSVIVCGAAIMPARAQEVLTLTGDNPNIGFIDDFAPLQTWQILANDGGFRVRDLTINPLTAPFHLDIGLPNDALRVTRNLLPPGSGGFNNVNVGIGGIASTGKHLHIRAANDGIKIRMERTDISPQIWELEANVNEFQIRDISGNTQPFRVESDAPTASLFIAANGSVGMGTATPDANSRLDIRSSLTNGLLAKRADANAHFLRVENSVSAFRCGVQGNGDVQFGALTSGKGLNLLAGGTGKVAINSSGQICFGNVPPAFTTDALKHQTGARLTAAGVWTNASSRTLKQDIEPITSEEARDAVRALQPVGYRYKSELNERYVGFIAEDVPELVATGDRKSLAPMDIVAVLTKVVQEQDRLLTDERQQNERQQQSLEQQRRMLDEQRAANADLKQMLSALGRRVSELEQPRTNATTVSK